MNRILEQLSVQDFDREMDERIFGAWKQSLRDHAGAGKVSLILFVIGLVLLMLIGGLIGLMVFFGLAIVGLAQTMPKRKMAMNYQRQLGITNEELKRVMDRVKNR